MTIRETAGVKLEVADANLAEGDDDAGEEQTTVTATVVPLESAAFEVTVAGGVGEGTRWEFVGPGRTLSFAANEHASTGTVTIRAIHNDVNDGDEPAATVTGTPVSPATVAVAAATFAVVDDDLPKVSILAPEFARNTGYVFEDETQGSSKWPLIRTGVTDEALTVTLRASESGGDFVAFADDVDQTLTFSANTSMTSYTPVTSDTIDEAHGTVTVTLRAGADYDIEGPAAATANVRDDDGMPLLAVTVDPAALSVREGLPAQFHAVGATVTDGTFTMPADLGRLFEGTGVTVNAASADGTGALAGTDYTALASDASAALLFADAVPMAGGTGLGLRAALPEIATEDDGMGDAGETFTVTVSLPTGHVDTRIVLGTQKIGTATLVEGPVVTLLLDDADLEEGETATVTATVDPVHTAPFTVTVATDPPTSDRFEFTDSNRVITFAASSANSTGTVRIRAVDNDVDDGDVEGIVLSGAPSLAAVAAPAALTFAVRDDDLPKVTLAAPAVAMATGYVFEDEATESVARQRWSVTRAGLLDEELTVTVRASESGGTNTDFVSFAADADQTVTFSATVAMTSYSPITMDTTDEEHGTVTVTLQAGAGYDIDGPPAAAAAVRDDDGTLLTVTVDPAALSVPEGQPARFHAAGATPTDGTFTVLGDLARVFGGTGVTVNAASADGTAMQPGDYTALATGASVTLTFADATPAGGGTGFGLRAALPAVDTVDDGTGDAGETFTVTLSLPTGQMDMRIVLDAQKVGTATLVEGPSVTLVLNDDDLTEGETATVTATVDPVHTLAFTVTVATDPVSSDRFEFVGSNRILSFAVGGANSTGLVEIRAVDNDVDDGDVEKGAADGFSVTGTADDVDVTAPEPRLAMTRAVPFAVRDDDLPKVSIAAPELARNTGHVFEAEVADLTATGGPWVLTRAGLTEAALAVTVAVSESGGDFVASATETADQTVTFAATEDTANYTPVTADTTDEVHGTVTVTLKTTGADYDIEGDAAAAADVRDDDGAGTLLVLGAAPATLTVAEGNAAQVSVAAKTVADGTFTQTGDLGRVFAGATSATVDASTGGGTATAGTDYTALASGTTVTVRFADLTVSGRGLRLATPAALPPVQTTDDETVDDNETFVVTLAKAAGTDARIGLDPATATVTIVEGPPNGSLRICGADGMCVTGAGVSCPATDLVCVSGMSAAVPAEGRLEVAWDGKFGTVCDDYWTTTDADVACRDIGHAAGQRAFVRSHFGGAERGVKIWFDDVTCLGSEATLAACPRSGGTGSAGSNNCSVRHTEDAGVRCLAAVTALPTVEARPMNLTVAPGDTARYWLSLTKRPDDEDFWAAPRAPAGVTVSPERVWMTNDEHGWSFAQWVDVTVSGDARVGDSHTIVHETTAHAYRDGTVPAVPDVTVTVAAPSSSGGPRPAGASVSGPTVTVRFDAPLDSAFAPSAADYVVLAGEAERRVSLAYVKGADLVLELAGGRPAGAPVRVAYAAGPSSPLADRAGRAVAPFELTAVRPAEADGLADGALEAPWTAADTEPFAATFAAAAKREGAAGLAVVVAEALRDAPEASAATLWAPRRGVVDLSELAALPALRRANLSGNAVADLGPLAGLRDLERLDLSGNAVTDTWALSGLAGLEVLDLSGNRIADVTALGGLPRLKVLELAGNAVTDVAPLLHLTELRYLGLAGNRVADAGPLSHLAGLVRLDLSGNGIADASPLGNLSQLVWLRLPGNRLERVDALGRLTALRWVWLADNPALAPDAAAVLPAGVRVDTGADGAAR